MNSVKIGSQTFDESSIVSGRIYLTEGIISDELQIDTLEITVWSETDLRDIPYGELAEYYKDDVLFAKLYATDVSREGKKEYKISCVSGVGLLEGIPHYGGLYTGQKFDEVAADIIGDVFPYTVSESAAKVQVYGWLPADDKRNNLHQLLFASGVSIIKDKSGDVVFDFLTTDNPSDISASRIYENGSIGRSSKVTEVQVTEHAYYQTSIDKEDTLFDNTDGSGSVENQVVTFTSPHYSLTPSSGITISESGPNYAIVTGTGTVTGKAYTHQTKTITKTAEDTTGTKNIVTVKESTLVNITNSAAVADRMLSYYSGAYDASFGIVVDGEKPGFPVNYINPFEESDVGIIREMDIQMSKIMKADIVVSSGYTPTGGGGTFDNLVVLTGSGTWNPPFSGEKDVRVTLIGGADGGDGGENGESGVYVSLSVVSHGGSSQSKSPGSGGSGGKGGSGKLGGKIYTETIKVSGPVQYSAGIGGTAGASNGGLGGSGTDSTFGSLSSANGAASEVGYVDVTTGTVYALPGNDGVDGAKGGSGGSVGNDGYKGDDTDTGTGGTGAGPYSFNDPFNGHARSGGSGGGGAAYNKNGLNASRNGLDSSGGNGASPDAPTPHTTYGSGGHGGHGGGGGGGGGGASYAPYDSQYDPGTIINNGAGQGGTGTPGTAGMNGCILVYY